MKWFALIAALALAACSGGAQDSPVGVVEAFYRTRLADPGGGAPSEAQLQALAPYLSDELQALLKQAREHRDRQAAAAPDKKPDFADGDLFSSLFEGPTTFTVGEAVPSGDRHRVPVALRHRHGQGETRWTDSAIVIRQGGRRVIADIEYGGDWDFANRSTLVMALRQTLAQRSGRPSWYGDWSVVAHRIPGIAAVTDAEAVTRYGQTARYAETQARFDSERCEGAHYRSRALTAAALYDAYRLTPAELGLGEPVTQVEVACATGRLGPGATLLVKAADTLLTPWDGAFYELQRR